MVTWVNDILWIKEVVPDDGSIAYEEYTKGDIFYLHWPNTSETRIEAIPNSAIILLKQYQKVTHLVMPITSNIKTNTNLKSKDKYPKCREVICVMRLNLPVKDIFKKECFDQGFGTSIQSFLKVNENELAKWQKSFIKLLGIQPYELQFDFSDSDYREAEFSDSKQYYKKHRIRERNRAVINDKITTYQKLNKPVECEVCGFSFSKYGFLGNDYIEIHYIQPFNVADKETITSEDDIIFICANCHKMVHRLKPMQFNLEKIKSELFG